MFVAHAENCHGSGKNQFGSDFVVLEENSWSPSNNRKRWQRSKVKERGAYRREKESKEVPRLSAYAISVVVSHRLSPPAPSSLIRWIACNLSQQYFVFALGKAITTCDVTGSPDTLRNKRKWSRSHGNSQRYLPRGTNKLKTCFRRDIDFSAGPKSKTNKQQIRCIFHKIVPYVEKYCSL